MHRGKEYETYTFVEAVRFSVRGIVYAFHTETNITRDVWLFSILCGIELIVRPPLLHVVLTLFVAMCVFAAELFNTAIELAVDLASNWKHHPVAGVAKDVASGAVSMVSIGALFIALWLLVTTWPWRFSLLTDKNVTGAILILVALVVVWVLRLSPSTVDEVIKRRRTEDVHDV